MHRFENDGSGDKADIKRTQSGGEMTPNNEHDEQSIKSGDSTLRDSSILSAPAGQIPESGERFGKDYQNQAQAPAQSHVKFPEFAAWCRSKPNGQPTEAGFWKWLCSQKPQWRNKRRPDFDEQGYMLNGKFLPAHEANAMALKNPELLTKFQRAIKRDEKVQPCA